MTLHALERKPKQGSTLSSSNSGERRKKKLHILIEECVQSIIHNIKQPKKTKDGF
jgi:hypothetical protein